MAGTRHYCSHGMGRMTNLAMLPMARIETSLASFYLFFFHLEDVTSDGDVNFGIKWAENSVMWQNKLRNMEYEEKRECSDLTLPRSLSPSFSWETCRAFQYREKEHFSHLILG